jgi:hypothetical protein
MVKAIAANFLALTLLFLVSAANNSAQAQTDEVYASLDRYELTRGETFVLTIRVHGQQGGVQMDMTPLQENFDIILTRTSSQLRTVNNRTESWTDYHLTLFPRTTGVLEVPALQVAGTTTEPLEVNVLAQTQTAMTPGQSIYMETIINKRSVYVQEQLLFTIRLYYTINGIRNPQFTELEMPNTVIQMIGSPNQYEKLIDEQRYGVYEKQYVIFPQRSGELTIPDIVFRGEVTDGSSNFVFRNMNTRTITAFSEGYTVEVKERPATFTSDTWLPAENVVITEEWSSDPTRLRVGDSISRTISITASGLDGAALPPLQRSQIDKLNLYPDPPSVGRTFIDGKIVGKRTESWSMVALDSGSVVLPEINVRWWNINNEQLNSASLPATMLVVAPAPAGASLPADIETDNAAIADNASSAGAERNNLLADNMLMDDLVAPAQTPPWITALAAVIAALVILIWYFAQRKSAHKTAAPQQKNAESSVAYADEIAENQEAQAFKRLEKICNEKDPARIRLALIAWGRQYFQDANLITLDDLVRQAGSSELLDSCTRIQAAVYGKYEGTQSAAQASVSADTAQLLSTIAALRKQRLHSHAHQRDHDNYALPPLYKV